MAHYAACAVATGVSQLAAIATGCCKNSPIATINKIAHWESVLVSVGVCIFNVYVFSSVITH